MSDEQWPDDGQVMYRGEGPFNYTIDNGHAVYCPDLPDGLSIYEGWRPCAGKFGGPPVYNRWAYKDDCVLIGPVQETT